MTSRTELVESLVARFPDVPREAVLKEDLLRTGIAFDSAALSDNLDGLVKPKSRFTAAPTTCGGRSCPYG
jgi:hypothetical protein